MPPSVWCGLGSVPTRTVCPVKFSLFTLLGAPDLHVIVPHSSLSSVSTPSESVHPQTSRARNGRSSVPGGHGGGFHLSCVSVNAQSMPHRSCHSHLYAVCVTPRHASLRHGHMHVFFETTGEYIMLFRDQSANKEALNAPNTAQVWCRRDPRNGCSVSGVTLT